MKFSFLNSHLFKQIANFLIPPTQANLPLDPHHSIILSQGRERILTAMLRVSSGLGFLSLLSVLSPLIRGGQWISITIYIISLIAVLIVAINRRINYRFRASLFLLVGYGLALLDLVDYGLGEDARVYLFGFVVGATLLLGGRIGLEALCLSIASLALTGWLISTDQFTPLHNSDFYSGTLSMNLVVITCANFLMTAGLVIAALQALLHDFDLAWQRERQAVNQVEQERALLEQRVAERTRELVLARDQALEASRLKTEILAKVSHELRTPLGIILGHAEMLLTGIFGSILDEQRQSLKEIVQSTDYLTNMITDLLSAAQLEAGRLALNISSFAPADLITSIYSKMNPQAQIKGLTLTTTIAADVPPVLCGDTHRLQQILINLIENAIKFTGQGNLHVSLYRPNTSYWALQVSDTGPGISSDAQKYIFEPFRQVDGSATREHSGVGLGLSIVKQLTALMGGEIRLTSEVGQGSTFTIWFPIISASCPPENSIQVSF